MERRKNNWTDEQHQSELGCLLLFLGPWTLFPWNTFAIDSTHQLVASPVDQLARIRWTFCIRTLAFGYMSKSNYMTFLSPNNVKQPWAHLLNIHSDGSLKTRQTFAGICEGTHSDKSPQLWRGGGIGGKGADGCLPRLQKTFASSKLQDLASKANMSFRLAGMDTEVFIYRYGSSQDLCRFSSTSS